MNKFLRLFFILGLVVFLPIAASAKNSCYYMYDEAGNVVYVTGWKVKVGDEFLTENNKRYEITEINGEKALVKLIGEINLVEHMVTKSSDSSFFHMRTAYAEGQKKVAIYHTHNDEAYIPSDGTESVDNGTGGIVKVGNAFSVALENNGLQAIHSDSNHVPHDDMAYERSRRTVVSLLKQQPAAIFDIHRDATPVEVYKGEIDGKDVTKVQLVVGKYGPTSKQVEEYALQMKAASDNKHPGLVKGIFFAKGGDYNQDLHPKSMLVEVGAHTNSREAAERGVAMFADAVPTVLGISSANNSNINGAAGVGTAASGPSGSMKSIGWIVGFLVVGIIVFMFLSTGSMKEMKAKYKNFTSKEFTNFFGFIDKKHKNGDKEK